MDSSVPMAKLFVRIRKEVRCSLRKRSPLQQPQTAGSFLTNQPRKFPSKPLTGKRIFYTHTRCFVSQVHSRCMDCVDAAELERAAALAANIEECVAARVGCDSFRPVGSRLFMPNQHRLTLAPEHYVEPAPTQAQPAEWISSVAAKFDSNSAKLMTVLQASQTGTAPYLNALMTGMAAEGVF